MLSGQNSKSGRLRTPSWTKPQYRPRTAWWPIWQTQRDVRGIPLPANGSQDGASATRCPPPYHGISAPTGRNPRQPFWLDVPVFDAAAFATGCHRLRPLGSMNASSRGRGTAGSSGAAANIDPRSGVRLGGFEPSSACVEDSPRRRRRAWAARSPSPTTLP
jgi:hypothetical protein